MLGDEESEDDSVVFGTIDNQLNGVEDEMMLLLSTMTSKRKRLTSNEDRNDKRRKKYDMKKLHFTDPFTMERKVFTYHYSIWYATYVVDPSPENTKWSKLFKRRFRMPYAAFLNLLLECNKSKKFKQ